MSIIIFDKTFNLVKTPISHFQHIYTFLICYIISDINTINKNIYIRAYIAEKKLLNDY